MNKEGYSELRDVTDQLETASLLSGERNNSVSDPQLKQTSFRRLAVLAITVTALAAVVTVRARSLSSTGALSALEEVKEEVATPKGHAKVFDSYGEDHRTILESRQAPPLYWSRLDRVNPSKTVVRLPHPKHASFCLRIDHDH